MKIIQVPSGGAPVWTPELSGNIASDGALHYYHEAGGMAWTIPWELFSIIRDLLPKEGEELAALESKKEVSITDLLALKTTYDLQEIIRLKESNLI